MFVKKFLFATAFISISAITSIAGYLYFQKSKPALAQTVPAPVLHFSDLTSGPKTGLGDGLGSGAIVTIWGVNLGGTQGTSKVYVGGVEAAYVYEWTNATQHPGHPADLYTYHKMQTIAFSVPATAVDGANTIKVVVNGATSNTLPFTVRAGKIYFVKTTGVDTGDGSGTNGDWNHPWATPQYYTNSLAGVSAGSILYILNGVRYSGDYGVFCSGRNGTADNPYFVSSYPGSSVIFTNNSRSYSGGFGPGYDGATNGGAVFKYWHISKITLQAGISALVFITGGRAVAVEVTDNANPLYACITNQGGLISGAGAGPGLAGLDGTILLGLYVHDYCANQTGDKQQHTMYLSNRSGRSNQQAWEVGWNHFENNWGNYGIHAYDEGTCVNWQGTVRIHDNVVVDQRGSGINVGPGCGTGYGPITTTFNIYNNLVIRSGRGPGFLNNTTSLFAMALGGNPNNGSGQMYTINAYNNTIYAAGEPVGGRDFSMGNPIIQGNIQIGQAFGSINFKNNIVYDTNNYPWVVSGSGTPNSASNNIWYSTTTGHASPPAWDTSPLTTNPQFTNPSTGDFHLQSSSPAIDSGINLISTVANDIEGITRPQGLAFDIGAYEFSSTTPPPPLKGDFNSDNKVNDLDFTSFKNAFKSIFNSLFDLNSDNAIDVKDLGVLMNSWLP